MDWIIEIRQTLKIPHTLKELINDQTKLELMSEMAYNDPSTSSNPVKLNKKDFLELYKEAYEGDL